MHCFHPQSHSESARNSNRIADNPLSPASCNVSCFEIPAWPDVLVDRAVWEVILEVKFWEEMRIESSVCLEWAKMALDHMIASFGTSLGAPGLTLESAVQALCVAVFVGLIFVKLRAPKLKLPPGPVALPIVGNWLQVCNQFLVQFLVSSSS